MDKLLPAVRWWVGLVLQQAGRWVRLVQKARYRGAKTTVPNHIWHEKMAAFITRQNARARCLLPNKPDRGF